VEICGLWVNCGKGKGLNEKWLEYSIFELSSNRKWHRLSPWLVDQRRAQSMVDRPPWPAVELTGAQPSGCSGPQRLAVRWGKGGHQGESNLANTEAWKAARRRRTGSKTLARKGGIEGIVRAKRRSVGGVGVFTEGRAAINKAEVRRGRSGSFNGRH
jgi:hypothetical protein